MFITTHNFFPCDENFEDELSCWASLVAQLEKNPCAMREKFDQTQG